MFSEYVLANLTWQFIKKLNKSVVGEWSENVNVTLPDSFFSKEVKFEKRLPINVDVLDIL